MLRRLFLAGLLSASLVAADGSKTAEAYVSVDVNLHFGSDTFWFDHAPRFVPVPYSQIYYSAGPECDIYRYGDWYYVNNGYDWYRAPGYAGPFTRISYIAVPHTIVAVPTKYRHYSRHYVTRDPWETRWRSSGGHDDGYWSNRDGRSYDRDGNWDRDRDGRSYDRDGNWNDDDRRGHDRDGRWSQRGGDRDDDRGKGHGKGHKKKGHGKGRGNGNGRAYGRS
jgi:hypothetical protein